MLPEDDDTLVSWMGSTCSCSDKEEVGLCLLKNLKIDGVPCHSRWRNKLRQESKSHNYDLERAD